MRALLPRAAEDVDVHAFYAAGWLDEGGLRANFIASADGAVSVAGFSRGLQTRADNRIFAALRDLADVVLVGAGTIRDEGYGALQLSARRRGVRREHGLAEALPIVVVSQSLRLDPSGKLFTGADADARTIVLTCAASDTESGAALHEVAEVLVCGDEDVNLAEGMAALAARGHRRVLCEGGPLLFGCLTEAGLVDELCLTVSPLLAGPGAGRVSAGAPWAHPPLGMRLAGLLEEDGALFCRYALPG